MRETGRRILIIAGMMTLAAGVALFGHAILMDWIFKR